MDARMTPDWEAEVQRRRDMLLNGLLMAATGGGLAALVLNYVALLPKGLNVQGQVQEMLPFTVCWLVIAFAWRWRGIGFRPRAWVCIALAYFIGVFTFLRGGLPGSGRVWMLLLPALAFVFLGPRPGTLVGLAGGLTYALFAILFSQGVLEPTALPDTVPDLNGLAFWGGEGASFLLVAAVLTVLLRSFILNWLDALARTSAANSELERTNVQLQHQASQLQTTAEIARTGSSTLDPDKLLEEMVHRVQAGFESMGVYYVGLHLLEDVDASEQTATLRAATGEAGRLLMAMGYSVKVDERTTVGRCIAHREAHIALNAGETMHLDVLPMPNTRSEIALPLRSRGRMLGALDAHSTQEVALDEEDIAALQMMADQVAVSIDNARLFSQTEAALKEVQAAHRRYLAESWRDFLATRSTARVDYSRPGTKQLGDSRFLRNARRAAMVHGRTVATSTTVESEDGADAFSPPEAALVVPLKLRGQMIGTMTLHEPDQQRSWTAQEVALAETVVEQVVLTIENLRLMDETQRRAAQEHTISAISDRMQRSPNIETLMRIAAEELARVLGSSRAYVRLSTTAQPAPGGAAPIAGRPSGNGAPSGDGHGDEGDI